MKRKHNGQPASQTFTGILQGGAGPFVDCSHCGRTHYAIDSEYLGDERSTTEERAAYIARIKKQAQDDPDGTILHFGCDGVYYYNVDTATIPDNCPCNGLRIYENFFWNNRHIFKNYMMHRKLALQAEIDDIGNVDI